MNPSIFINKTFKTDSKIESSILTTNVSKDTTMFPSGILLSNLVAPNGATQKISPPQRSHLNVVHETNPFPNVVLPPRLQHMLSSPTLSSSTKLPSNGRPPGVALCLSKSNARQLFLCLLKQQQQQGFQPGLKLAELLKNQVVLENTSQVQHQNNLITTTAMRPSTNSTCLKLLPTANLISSGHDKVVLVQQAAQKSFRKIISVHQKPNPSSIAPTDLSCSSNIIVAHDNHQVNHRSLIRLDASLEKLRVSSHKVSRTSASLKPTKDQSKSSRVLKVGNELFVNFHSPAVPPSSSSFGTFVDTASTTTNKRNGLQPKSGVVQPTNKVSILTAKKSPSSSLCTSRYFHKSDASRGFPKLSRDSRKISKSSRKTNSDGARCSKETDVTSSTTSVFEDSSDELSYEPPSHRMWWGSTTDAEIVGDDNACFNLRNNHDGELVSSRIRLERLIGREKRRLHSLRRRFQVLEMIEKQGGKDPEEGVLGSSDKKGIDSNPMMGEGGMEGCTNFLRQVSKTINRSNHFAPYLKACQHRDIADALCPHLALPYTNHCSKHIMYSIDQQLYTYCTAKCPNNVQCCVAVLNIGSGPPLCHKHRHMDTSKSSAILEEFSKKSRKKNRSVAPGKSLKKGSRRKGITKEVMMMMDSCGGTLDRSDVPKEFVCDAERCDESTEHGPLCDRLSESVNQNLASSEYLPSSAFEFTIGDVPLNFCKESLDEVLSGDFLGDFDFHDDASSCFMDTHDEIHDVFGKPPVEVFNFGSSSLRHF